MCVCDLSTEGKVPGRLQLKVASVFRDVWFQSPLLCHHWELPGDSVGGWRVLVTPVPWPMPCSQPGGIAPGWLISVAGGMTLSSPKPEEPGNAPCP